jgi:hypothetical protein
MIQLLRSFIRDTLLLEAVYGAQATVYHGTKANPQELIQSILNDEFRPGEGEGSLYGKGIYTVHELNNTPTERGRYGNHVLKLKVKLDDYIIFDRDVVTRVYGKPLLPQEQALRAGLDDTVVEKLGKAGFNQLFDPEKFSSDTAERASKFLAGKCKGIVYSGRNDGRCVLVYDPATVVPMAWKPIGAKTWNPVERSSLKGALRRSASGEWDEGKYTPLGILRRLEKLPPNQRVVNGNLDLRHSLITSLPQGLVVGGELDLRHSLITSLPQGLVVGGDLYLQGTRIKSLPQDLKVGGSLWLQNSSITSLSQGLEVGATLYLSNAPITSLPQDLKVGDNLFLSGTLITSLPQGLVVNGSLELIDAPITSLPQGLVVGGILNLLGTPITSLPQGLRVGGDLNLEDTSITSLPQDMEVGGSIWGFKGDRSKAPLHLQGKIK